MLNAPTFAKFQRCGEKSQLEALGHIVRQLNLAMQAGRTIDKRTIYDAKSLFAALDKDKDGSLSREEVARGLKRLDVVMEAALFQMLLDTMDLNSDGLVDMAEFLHRLNISSYTRPSHMSPPRKNFSGRGAGPAIGKVRSDRSAMTRVRSDGSDASTAIPFGKSVTDASTTTRSFFLKTDASTAVSPEQMLTDASIMTSVHLDKADASTAAAPEKTLTDASTMTSAWSDKPDVSMVVSPGKALTDASTMTSVQSDKADKADTFTAVPVENMLTDASTMTSVHSDEADASTAVPPEKAFTDSSPMTLVRSDKTDASTAVSPRRALTDASTMTPVRSDTLDASTVVPPGQTQTDASTMAQVHTDRSDTLIPGGRVAADVSTQVCGATTTESSRNSMADYSDASTKDELQERVAHLERELALVRSQSEGQLRLAESLRQRLADVEVDQRSAVLQGAREQHSGALQPICVISSPPNTSRQIPLQHFPNLLRGLPVQQRGASKMTTQLMQYASVKSLPSEPVSS
eukprot:TRINITY_DN6049_c0_g1_i1.p1 TRINITY_DN6049_c0_g1~~TRINITY_DN6049_c0_g1_i1.p1  ORF type:complete len:519 (-),score=93.85 TRINITY_DN6049_c0_g1_i1:228-1784(-)